MIQKRMRKTIALLLAVVLLCASLGVMPVSAATAEASITKRGLALCGWHNATDSSITEGLSQYEPLFYNDIELMKRTFQLAVFHNDQAHSKTEAFINQKGTNQGAIDKIKSFFKYSKGSDTNYLFLDGHGSPKGYKDETGKLAEGICLCKNGKLISYSEIKATLDKIPGHFVLFIHSCYSGQALSVFTGAKYTVFCSSAANETTFAFQHNPTNLKRVPLVSDTTAAWMTGLGMEFFVGALETYAEYNGELLADKNGDHVVTPEELNYYTKKKVKAAYDEWYNKCIAEGYQVPYECPTSCYTAKYAFESIGYENYPLGNPTGTGTISLQDVLLIRQYMAGTATLNSRQKVLADVNWDKLANMQDVLLIRSYLADI